ncbi:hypothetical protein [Cellulomonas hominis]|uniref:hypothetical protein n=1 Tax=Cellulomonas hominis TaxID=156981 RepID=UPI001B9C56CD|nr:hypothetical protein [Cellulomonas hominis]VTR77101.1 hypothetical protein CHMI_01869 [Cellulomonas hominis]
MTTHDTTTGRAGTRGVGAAAGGGTGTTGSTAPDAAPSRVRPQPRGWAVAGIGAGLAGIVSIQASLGLSVDWEQTAGDADAIVAGMAGKTGTMILFHTATLVATVLVVIFAAGLSRRLGQQAPAGSLLPAVASGGLLLVAVAGLLGSGLDTQFMFGFADPELLVPESGAFYTDWIATIPWLWVGARPHGAGRRRRRDPARGRAAVDRLGQRRARGPDAAARHLAAAVHGRVRGSALAARRGHRVRGRRPEVTASPVRLAA